MKVHFVVLIVLGVFLGAASCDKNSEVRNYEVDFKFSSEAVDPNNVVFKNTSSGEYSYVRWNFGDGEITDRLPWEEADQLTHYYPYAGSYKVRLTVWGSSDLADNASITKTVVIEKDDPNYVEQDKLIWSDEFDGTSVNSNNWTFEVGHGSGGWGNNELQYYTNGDNVQIVDGKLVITAEKVNNEQVQGSYTSIRMISWHKQEFKYGRIEVRAKLPSGRGIWPAIWMLGSDIDSKGWPACGEIDIMEYVGYEPDVVHATVHTTSGSGVNGNGNSKILPTCEEEFHVYGLNWTADKLVFYVDTPDNIVHTYNPSIKTEDNWPFNSPHFFILNVAVGGNWGGAQGIDNTIFPQTMELDYIRVYKLDE